MISVNSRTQEVPDTMPTEDADDAHRLYGVERGN